jgi:transcriptional regulator of nitric oxide reductase
MCVAAQGTCRRKRYLKRQAAKTNPMDLTPFLTSAVVAALVAGLVTLRSAERRIQIENITQERAKWREKIRANALLVQQAAATNEKAKLAELGIVFALLLNPHDSEDTMILQCIDDMKNALTPEPKMPEFSGRVAFLLKHDWERAKHEAKPWFYLLAKEPSRPVYA